MIARALKFVRHERIEDHLRLGWMVMIPNALMHHHHYSVEMKWICQCPVPGGFRIPETTSRQEGTHERA